MIEVYGVFEGGGVRGTALVGAVAAAEKKGIGFCAVAGTSAGAIVASLIAAGYKAEEMRTLLTETDFKKFMDPVSRVPLWRRYAAWRRLGLYKGDEFRRWIAEKISIKLTGHRPEFDMRYADDGALERIITTTNGQPFLTQAIAFELVQFLNGEKRKVATAADVEEAITRAMESGGEYFANVWSDAGEEGRAILLAIARGETPPDFPSAENRLRNHDLLNSAGQFAVPMVERWVREKRR